MIVGGSAASRCAAGGVLSSCDTPDTPLCCLAAIVKSCASARAVFDAGAAPREPGRFNGTTSTLDPVENGAPGRGADNGARLRGTIACAGVSGGGARTGGAESGTGGAGAARIGEAKSGPGAERRKSEAGVLPAMEEPNAAFATLKFATLASGQGVSIWITPGSYSEIVASTASLNADKAPSGSLR